MFFFAAGECIVTPPSTHSFLPIDLPSQMTVQGCPVIIEKDVVGMTVMKNEAGDSSPLLLLGDACVDSSPLIREFFLKNNGSSEAKVSWRVTR